MRMKLNKPSQLLLVALASILVAGLMTACSTLTVDIVFVASSKAAGANNYGELDIFEVNSESGRMRQIPASPVPSQGRYPSAEATSTDAKNLFVANKDDNTIVQFVIGNDGKLYPFNTVNTPGIFPLGLAASSANLFVIDTYQPLPTCSTAAPCSGSIGVLPLVAGGSTSGAPCTASTCINPPAVNTGISATYWPLTVASSPNDVIMPTAVAVLASGSDVYVAAYDTTVSPTVGYIFGFSVGSGGVLTALPGSPYAAGIKPSGLASDKGGKYLYATDASGNNVLAYTITSGALTTLAGSPFKSGTAPSAIVVDQQYNFAYVANATDSTITAYSVSNGVLASIGSYATGLQPVALGIDPSTNHFLYSANFLGNNVSGFELNTTAGTLLDTFQSPFAANNQPTAVAAIPHAGIVASAP